MEVMVATEVLKERVIREYKDLITGEENSHERARDEVFLVDWLLNLNHGYLLLRL